MTTYYVDSSALAKRYVNETGSAWIRGLAEPSAGNVLVVCELTPIEVFSVLEAHRRSKSIRNAARLLLLQKAFLVDHNDQYLSVDITPKILIDARDLVTRYKLWTLDAIHLACAIEFRTVFSEPTTFISADNELLAATTGEGFPTDNPLNYP